MPSYKHYNITAMSRTVFTRKTGSVADRKTEMCSLFDVYDVYQNIRG